MSVAKLRQQGGAIVVTIPSEVAATMGWTAGDAMDFKAHGDHVEMKPVTRKARGRKTMAELLSGIDAEEVKAMNEDLGDFLDSEPVGREIL